MKQARVTCPTCERETAITRTAIKCSDGNYRACTITREHKAFINVCGVQLNKYHTAVISIDLAVN